MSDATLSDLQESVRDRSAFGTPNDYKTIACAFLTYLEKECPTRIVSPSHPNYMFYQYDAAYGHRITRPLNADLMIESGTSFGAAFDRFLTFLDDLRTHQQAIVDHVATKQYLESHEICRVVYTTQQALGSISDSFDNPNQSRKRVGQLFETFVQLVIQQVGLKCEPRTVSIPIPGYPGHSMSYELDLVFSRHGAIIASETSALASGEIVGSVKTTSKDRIDKIFLDKFLLSKLLGRDVPVIAIFLHDVQRARRGNSIFAINSTFKTNHFLGYTLALNRLDGVYYVDPRPDMIRTERLREQISDFQQFLVSDLWTLSK